MIVHEIKGPAPPPAPSIPEKIRHVREIIGRRMGGQPPSIRENENEVIEQYGSKCMTKLGYSLWAEREVLPKFPKGTLVTMRGLAYIPNTPPSPVFRVTDIQEVNWLAPIDPHFKEPRALCVAPFDGGAIHMMCPSSLRPLYGKEIELVNSRNPRSQRQPNVAELVPDEAFPDPSTDNGDYAG